MVMPRNVGGGRSFYLPGLLIIWQWLDKNMVEVMKQILHTGDTDYLVWEEKHRDKNYNKLAKKI